MFRINSILGVENNTDIFNKLETVIYNNKIYVKFVDKLIKIV